MWTQLKLKRRGLQPQVMVMEEPQNCDRRKKMIAVGLCSKVHHKFDEEEEVVLNNFDTLVASLKACAKQKDLHKGSRVHADIIKRGLFENNIIGNTLVSMYAKCGTLAKAEEVFNELPVRNLVTWNALIAGYTHHGRAEEALKCYEQMRGEGFSPDEVTFACILKACGSIGDSNKGLDLHVEMAREGLLRTSLVASNALLDMYSKCGSVLKAQEVFNELPTRDVVSWTTIIGAYTEHGRGEVALHCFEQMQQVSVSPNMITFICILRACGMIKALDKGQEIHAQVVKQGEMEKSIILGTALIDMYAKCGMLAKAEAVADEMPARNVVSWTALITGYAQQGLSEEALLCFERMQCEELSPNAVTFSSILNACGSVGAAYKGQQIHHEVVTEDLLADDESLGTALLDMYAKCGMLAEAQDVFDELSVREVPSWNALFGGYAQHAQDEIVFTSIGRMVAEGKEPNLVTFNIVLNACSHRGLLDEGQMFFITMSRGFGIIPTLEHLNCMIDLFGSAGHFDMAVLLIEEMPFFANITVWLTMLGACQRFGNMNLGLWAFKHAAQLDTRDEGAYVLMSNIFVAAGYVED